MPGLVGIVDRSLALPLDSVLKGMLAKITEDWYQVDQCVDEAAGVAVGRADLGITNTRVQPYTSPDNKLCIFLYGDIYSPRSIADASKSDAGILPSIAAAYRDRGCAFVNELGGEFFIAIVDKQKNALYLLNDRYGRRPVYYSDSGNRFAFSSEIKAILSVPGFSPRVDKDALAEFLTFGYVLGENTLLGNVSMLPPAGILKYSLKTGRIDVSRYWDLRQNLSPLDISNGSILDQAAASFKLAVERRLSSSQVVGISLSGGMDSRVIAAAVDPREGRIKSLTSGLTGCVDEKVTAKIASAVGLEHIFYEFDDQLHKLSRSGNMELILEAIVRTDGMRGTSSSAMTAFSARKRRELGLDVVLTGHGGEIAKLDNAYNFSIHGADESERIAQDIVGWSFKRMSQASAPRVDKSGLFQGGLSKSVMQAPRERLAQVLRSLDERLPVAQKVSFLFLNELFRKRALYALAVHRAFAEIRLPFYDDDFLGVVVRAPYEVRSNYRMHAHIINTFKPELMNIELSDTRMKPKPGRIDKLLRGVPFKLLKKSGFFKRDFPEDYFQANSDPEFFRNILMDKKTIERGYLNPGMVAGLIEDNARGRRDVYPLLHLLVISEIWHREYIDGS